MKKLMNKPARNSEQGFAHLLLIIFLIAAIALGVYLVGQNTGFFPRAYNLTSLSNPISPPISPTPTPTPTPTSTPPPASVVRVIYPNGGETFRIGTTIRVTYQATNVDSCMLGYQFDGKPNVTLGSINPKQGYYNWATSKLKLPAVAVKAKITLTCTAATNTFSDQSDKSFILTRNALKK